MRLKIHQTFDTFFHTWCVANKMHENGKWWVENFPENVKKKKLLKNHLQFLPHILEIWKIFLIKIYIMTCSSRHNKHQNLDKLLFNCISLNYANLQTFFFLSFFLPHHQNCRVCSMNLLIFISHSHHEKWISFKMRTYDEIESDTKHVYYFTLIPAREISRQFFFWRERGRWMKNYEKNFLLFR